MGVTWQAARAGRVVFSYRSAVRSVDVGRKYVSVRLPAYRSASPIQHKMNGSIDEHRCVGNHQASHGRLFDASSCGRAVECDSIWPSTWMLRSVQHTHTHTHTQTQARMDIAGSINELIKKKLEQTIDGTIELSVIDGRSEWETHRRSEASITHDNSMRKLLA